jgi:hypothetical protein
MKLDAYTVFFILGLAVFICILLLKANGQRLRADNHKEFTYKPQSHENED